MIQREKKAYTGYSLSHSKSPVTRMVYFAHAMNAGIYIHIPFCHSRCSYCDFATGMYETNVAERYVHALINEIRNWTAVTEPAAIDTIYFGGGTPSLLSIQQIERILKLVYSRFDIAEGAEVTIEMNPGDAEGKQDVSSGWRRLGINRVSFGAQTFDDDGLRQLGRTHTSNDIRRTFHDLREAAFDNVN